MAAEEATPAEAKPRPCSSRACRTLTSLAIIGSGFWVFSGVSNDTAGEPWKRAKPWNRFRMGLSICLIAWGLTNLMKAPVNR